jgi:hypothetical protein
VAARLRARTALLIGALDKVGLIPVLIGAYFPLRSLFREQPPSPSELDWIIGMVAGLGVLYFMAFGLLLWVQRLDEACMVLKMPGRRSHWHLLREMATRGAGPGVTGDRRAYRRLSGLIGTA